MICEEALTWPVAPTTGSCFVCGVLQSNAHALGVGQGCAPGSGGPAVRCHCRYPNLGRAAPPIRPDMIFGKDTLDKKDSSQEPCLIVPSKGSCLRLPVNGSWQ